MAWIVLDFYRKYERHSNDIEQFESRAAPSSRQIFGQSVLPISQHASNVGVGLKGISLVFARPPEDLRKKKRGDKRRRATH